MSPPRAVALVVARLSSSRFAAKQFRKIGGRSILDRIFDELAKCRNLSEALLATVAEEANEPLKHWSAARGVPLFWYEGGPDDVTGRLTKAAREHDAEICLLISADCPLLHAPSIDAIINHMAAHPEADSLSLPPKAPGQSCLLEGVNAARFTAWERADALSIRPEEREHQFPVLNRAGSGFTRTGLFLDQALYGQPHRMSVDTWADLEFMETLFARLEAAGRPFTLPEAVSLMNREPALREINGHVHQRRLVEDIAKVLFVADAGGSFGYGHFMRCREFAGQVVERLSWPVTFLVDDEKAARMATDCGFNALWGALGRACAPPPQGCVEVSPPEAGNGFDAVVVDISARRSPPPGWRAASFPQLPVVALDRADSFSSEADLALFPGVTGRLPSPGSFAPPLAHGLEFAIIRREVRRYGGLDLDREVDVVTYLYSDSERAEIDRLARPWGWKVVHVTGFREDFPKLLAGARVFVSGFGQSFYEAAHLGCFPVAWPLSPLHEADASAFYAALGVAPAIIGNQSTAGKVLEPLLNSGPPALTPLADGTPNLSARLRELRGSWKNR